jgi:uncharacterized protein YeaO (DUF488 family)
VRVAIRIVRLGSPRKRGEGTRLGTVRRPPRGIRKERYAVEDHFDVWLPNLAPSARLMRLTKNTGGVGDSARWRRFAARYRSEMNKAENRRVIKALAALSRHANFSVGCYCDDERRCHRSILRGILKEHGAKISPG